MDKSELIARYVLHTLSDEEQQVFDDYLLNDPEFAKEVKFQADLKRVISNEEQIKAKKQLEDLESTIPSNKKTQRTWMAVASFILLLGVTAFWYVTKPVNTDTLFEAYFEPYRNVVQPIVRSQTDSLNKIQKAFNAYELKMYDEAIPLFDVLLAEDDNATYMFYKANILLEKSEIEEAISLLEKSEETIPESFKDKHLWYSALAYLKQNNLENAKASLLELQGTKSEYKAEEVQKLIRILQ